MSKYFETKKGSLEDMVAGVTEGKQSEDYKQLFKKELEKAGKGIGAMSDQEKKDFFNKIDKKHTAKNEDSKKVQKMNVKKSSGEDSKKLKEETELDEKKQYHMYTTKAAAEKKAKEIGGKVEKSTAAHFQGYYAVKEETEAKSIEQSLLICSPAAEFQTSIIDCSIDLVSVSSFTVPLLGSYSPLIPLNFVLLSLSLKENPIPSRASANLLTLNPPALVISLVPVWSNLIVYFPVFFHFTSWRWILLKYCKW